MAIMDFLKKLFGGANEESTMNETETKNEFSANDETTELSEKPAEESFSAPSSVEMPVDNTGSETTDTPVDSKNDSFDSESDSSAE